MNRTRKNGTTAIMDACVGGFDKCVKVLLQSGADVNIVSNDGTSALTLALLGKYKKCLELLLDRTTYSELLHLLTEYCCKNQLTTVVPIPAYKELTSVAPTPAYKELTTTGPAPAYNDLMTVGPSSAYSEQSSLQKCARRNHKFNLLEV